MKTIALILIMSMLTFEHAYAWKINLHGSGGLTSSGGNTKICPGSSSEICATIEGPLWEIVGAWLHSLKTVPLTLSDIDVTYFDAAGLKITSYDLTIKIDGCNVDYISNQNQEATISNVNITIIK